MARMLQAEGEEVALIALLDSHLPEQRGTLDLRDRAQIQYERLREGGVEYLRDWARGKYRWEAQRLRRRLIGGSEGIDEATQYHSQLIYEAVLYARSVYQPRFYDGHIVVFRPPLAPMHHLAGGRVINKERGFLREDNGWRRMVRSVEIHELVCPPGDHDGFVLEPFVRDLARRLRAYLPE
jgi:thioesterase domain-containing protein